VSDMLASTAPSPRSRRIAVDDYYRMGEVGIFRPDERVELLNGRIVEMPPIGPRHSYAVAALNAKLTILLGDRAITFCQGPVRLGRFSEPEPDIVVARGPRERYLDAHPAPADVLLVIEVSDATLRYDRGEKQKAYATAMIPEYWIVDLRHRRIDVYTDPNGNRYRTHTAVPRGHRLAPRAFPTDILDVEEILGT